MAARLKRILIADPDERGSRFLGSLLKSGLQSRVFVSAFADAGFALAQSANPQLVFVEHPATGLDGYELVRRIRRSDLPCRKVPIVMVTAEATAPAIAAARDAGLHEFLRKPYTTGELQRRLEVMALVGREWVEGIGYVGPDRRRFNAADYRGPRRRAEDHIEHGANADEERLLQALRIVRSARSAGAADLPQVRRALAAQAVEIQRNPAAPAALKQVVDDLVRWSAAIDVFDLDARAGLVERLEVMMRFLPANA